MNSTRTTTLKAALISLGFLSVGGAWSQALPPVGQTPELRQEASPISAPAQPRAPVANTAITVKVTGFTFTGNTTINTEELQRVVAASVGQALDLGDLDKVADSVSRHYRSKGYTLAKAYLPAQESANGIIQLAIIEGQYGAINLKNTSDINDERLRLTIANNLCDLADGKDCVGKTALDIGLERAVLLIKELPGVNATASLKPGSAVGTSDLELEIKPAKRTAYSLGFDNYGTPATGVTRLNAGADMNNLRRTGDQLTLGIATTTTANTKTGSAAYSEPLGYRGQRVGLAFARSQYRLGAGFSASQSVGTSNALSAFTSYPIRRSLNQTLYVRGSVEVRSAINEVRLEPVESYFRSNANVVRVGLNGDHVDSIYGGGYNAYSLTFSQGYTATNNSADATGARSAGRFGKISYSLARQQALNGPMTLYGNINGQMANKNLDGSEQTGLGGPSSARGYGGEVGGSTGSNATIELRYTTPIQIGSELSNITYAAFVDRGWVRYYERQITVGVQNTRALSSYGLTVTLQSQAKVPTPTTWGYYARAMYGWHSMQADQQSGVEPTSRGKFWLQGGVNF
jgi:hemolysin activation/secretion protein